MCLSKCYQGAYHRPYYFESFESPPNQPKQLCCCMSLHTADFNSPENPGIILKIKACMWPSCTPKSWPHPTTIVRHKQKLSKYFQLHLTPLCEQVLKISQSILLYHSFPLDDGVVFGLSYSIRKSCTIQHQKKNTLLNDHTPQVVFKSCGP